MVFYAMISTPLADWKIGVLVHFPERFACDVGPLDVARVRLAHTRTLHRSNPRIPHQLARSRRRTRRRHRDARLLCSAPARPSLPRPHQRRRRPVFTRVPQNAPQLALRGRPSACLGETARRVLRREQRTNTRRMHMPCETGETSTRPQAERICAPPLLLAIARLAQGRPDAA